MSYGRAMSWQDAEQLAAQHLANMGYRDVRRMPDGPDGGIDVVGSGVLAQVKHWATPVGIAEVQRHRGAVHSGDAVFYSLSGYTSAATKWAEGRGVALFRYDDSSNVSPANSVAAMLVIPFRLHHGDEAPEYQRVWGEFAARKLNHDEAWVALITSSAAHFGARPELFSPSLESRFMAMFHAEQGFNSTFSQTSAIYREQRRLPPLSEVRRMLRSLNDLEAAWAQYWRRPFGTLLRDDQSFRFDPVSETWIYHGGHPIA